jgi:hypothetical protein
MGTSILKRRRTREIRDSLASVPGDANVESREGTACRDPHEQCMVARIFDN